MYNKISMLSKSLSPKEKPNLNIFKFNIDRPDPETKLQDLSHLKPLIPPDRELGKDIGPIYFEDVAPSPEIAEEVITYSNRVIELKGKDGAELEGRSEVLVVVAGSTEPTEIVAVGKTRSIKVLHGKALVMIERANGKREAVRCMPEGGIGQSGKIDLYPGDSYAVVRVLGSPDMLVYHDVSEPGYDIEDEVRSESLAPHLEETLLPMLGYEVAPHERD